MSKIQLHPMMNFLQCYLIYWTYSKIIIIICNMSIKINFDEIFHSASTQDLNSNSHIEQYQPSDSYVQSNEQSKYRMKIKIFQQSSQQTSKQQDELQRTPPSLSSGRSSGYQQPGERLYYQSKDNLSKKKQQYERIRLEKDKDKDKPTFKPTINKNTEKILSSKYKNGSAKRNKEGPIFPSYFKKQQQQYAHCTFTPQLIAKQPKSIHRHDKSKVFQQLFYDKKLKQVRQKLKLDFQTPKEKQKKLTKQQFQNFINRTTIYMNKVQKKNQLLSQSFNKFDLQTGHKLFTPKINTPKSIPNNISKKYQQENPTQIPEYSPTFEQTNTRNTFNQIYDEEESDQKLFPSAQEWRNSGKDSDNTHMKQIHQDQQEQKSESEQQFKTVNCLQFPQHENHLQQPKQNQQQQQINHPEKMEQNEADCQTQLKFVGSEHVPLFYKSSYEQSEQQVSSQNEKSQQEKNSSNAGEESQTLNQQ